MSSKTAAIFILILTLVAAIFGVIISNESDLNTQVAYTQIDNGKTDIAEKEAEIDLGKVKGLDTIEIENMDTSNLKDTGSDNKEKDEHGCIESDGYIWCKTKNKCLRTWEEPCTDLEINQLVEDLEKYVDADFSAGETMSFSWKTSMTDLKISGIKFEAIKVPIEKTDKIPEFFKEQNFKTDTYNISAETFYQLTGYFKEKFACQIQIGTSGYKFAEDDWKPKNPDVMDIELYCGFVK